MQSLKALVLNLACQSCVRLDPKPVIHHSRAVFVCDLSPSSALRISLVSLITQPRSSRSLGRGCEWGPVEPLGLDYRAWASQARRHF